MSSPKMTRILGFAGTSADAVDMKAAMTSAANERRIALNVATQVDKMPDTTAAPSLDQKIDGCLA